MGAPTTTEATTTEAPVTTAPVTTTKYTTKDCTKPTTEAPAVPVGGECDASCIECVAIPGNDQAAIDSHCMPCGGDTMQSWWPCNLDDVCQCKRRRNVLV